MSDCNDVCEILTSKLIQLGFEIDMDDDNHDDVIDALQKYMELHSSNIVHVVVEVYGGNIQCDPRAFWSQKDADECALLLGVSLDESDEDYDEDYEVHQYTLRIK